MKINMRMTKSDDRQQFENIQDKGETTNWNKWDNLSTWWQNGYSNKDVKMLTDIGKVPVTTDKMLSTNKGS